MFFKINIILFPWFFNGIMKTGLSTFDIQKYEKEKLKKMIDRRSKSQTILY